MIPTRYLLLRDLRVMLIALAAGIAAATVPTAMAGG